METKDIIDINFQIVGNINQQWYLYLLGMLAFDGWIFTRKEIIRFKIKLIMTFSVIILMAVHLYSLVLYYNFLDVFVNELVEVVKNTEFQHPNTKKEIINHKNYMFYWKNIYWLMHIILDIIIIYIIWYDNIWKLSQSKDLSD